MFSLGCNGIIGFESDIRSRYPHCSINVYDPTISEDIAASVAASTNVRHSAGARSPEPFEMHFVHLISIELLRSAPAHPMYGSLSNGHAIIAFDLLLFALMCPALRMQATVHRTWIDSEAVYQSKAAQGVAPNYTTVAREMQTIGAPWINLLKMVHNLSRRAAPAKCCPVECGPASPCLHLTGRALTVPCCRSRTSRAASGRRSTTSSRLR